MPCDFGTSPNEATINSYLACSQMGPARYAQADVEIFAHRVGAEGGKNNWVFGLTCACLRVNRVIYWRKTPGDGCGGRTGGSNLVKGATLAGQGASVGGSGLALVAPLTAAGPVGLAVGAAAIAAGIIAGIFGHHAHAVQVEQDTLCDVFAAYNQYADQAEAFLASGQWNQQDAEMGLAQMHDRLKGEASQISKQYNAAFGYVKVLDALQIFNEEVVYPSIGPGSGLEGKGLLVGAAVAGAKILGVF